MLRNYFRIAWRSLFKNRSSSFINIAGLSVGMAVAMLIAFWIYDEWSFDKQNVNYKKIAQVMESQAINNNFGTQEQIPLPVATVLRSKFGSDFKKVVLSSMTANHLITAGEKKLNKAGKFIEPDGPALLDLQMRDGSINALTGPDAIFLSASLARAIFGNTSAIGKSIRFDDSVPVTVTGVYEDFPYNNKFHEVTFLSTWQLYVRVDAETRNQTQEWEDNGWQVFVQLSDHADFDKVSARIRTIKSDNDKYVKPTDLLKPVIFLHPMSKWHLYSEFKQGANTGGLIAYVNLFAIIGIFVLLLACINFMNLSTARSERRAKEVGIRKTIGSLRSQLVFQFFAESLLVTLISFLFALAVVKLSLPLFNDLADKHIMIPWNQPLLWIAGLSFCLITGIIAGSYPALYLSSFRPVEVLKGVFHAGKLAALPRKILVVTQFSVSIALIIGTAIVLKQVQYARSRPVGYNREGLLSVETHSPDIHKNFTAFRDELIRTGAVEEVAESTMPTTEIRNQQGNFNWRNRKPGQVDNFADVGVTWQYGKTVGLKIVDGRDFRTDTKGFDKLTMILNESAAKGMGFTHPVGEIIQWYGYNFTVIGVFKDIVMESPYKAAEPTIYYNNPFPMNILNIRIKPSIPARDALTKMQPVFAKFNPAEPFDYKFVDQAYDAKFRGEDRIGKLSGVFAGLAIFISCLGLFGLASFVAEQRVKEIGVRKILGASVLTLWKLLSQDFIWLILLSCAIAIPVSYLFLHGWLQQYAYHTNLSWWIFAAAAIAAIALTLITVSYQSLRAAFANPVKSLRTE